MVDFFLAVLAGLICGVLSGFGIGGGSLLMVWLTALLSMDQRTAQGINLLYFLPAAGCCSLVFHVKNRQIVWKAVVPAAIAGCLTAIPGALLAGSVDTALLRRLFGGFLVLVGISEVFFKGKKPAAQAEPPDFRTVLHNHHNHRNDQQHNADDAVPRKRRLDGSASLTFQPTSRCHVSCGQAVLILPTNSRNRMIPQLFVDFSSCFAAGDRFSTRSSVMPSGYLPESKSGLVAPLEKFLSSFHVYVSPSGYVNVTL